MNNELGRIQKEVAILCCEEPSKNFPERKSTTSRPRIDPATIRIRNWSFNCAITTLGKVNSQQCITAIQAL
jgi:hypothetical protein